MRRSLAVLLALLAACSGHPPAAAPPAPAPKPHPPAAPRTVAERCQAGELAACDALAELWGGRELLPEGSEAEARAAALALKDGCDVHALSTACMGLALMLKYGTAKAALPGLDDKPYWGKLKGLRDLNGYRGEARSPEGEAVLAETRAACEAGRSRACDQVGWAAYSEVERPKSIADALTAYRRACELGSLLGCRWAGHFAHTYPELGAVEQAEAWLVASCKGGFAAGCEELGVMLDAKGDPAALGRHVEGCKAGSRDACAALVRLCEGGAAEACQACDARPGCRH